ncbi:hypothetical protein [Nocardia sp. NBC_00416]|uniref:hypothetical protein n=1 Tax=Nocardia sp. NBC_00416 TaxID=2975991 RepID=UPI002E1FF005
MTPFSFDGRSGGGVRFHIDQVLADDPQRAAWRAHWRDMLDSLGAADAAARAPAPVAWSSPEDQ